MNNPEITPEKVGDTGLERIDHELGPVFEFMEDGIVLREILYDASGKPFDYRYLYCNLAFEKITGLRKKAIHGRLESEVLPEINSQLFDFYNGVAHSGESAQIDYWDPLTGKYLLIVAYRPAPGRIATLIRDVTEIKTAEKVLKELNLLKSARTEILASIVHSKNKEELLPEVCRIMVDVAEMKMASIGLVDPQTKRVFPMTSYGSGTEYVSEIEISTDGDLAAGCGPTGTAIRQNRLIWVNDFSSDPSTVLWHEKASRYGWRSSAALPFRVGEQKLGALTLYSASLLTFSEEMNGMLRSLAETISFALESYLSEKQRLAYEEELKKFHMAVEQCACSVVITNSTGNIEYVNKAFEDTTGYEREEAVGKNPRILKSGEQSESFYKNLWFTVTSGKSWTGVFHNKRKNGFLFWEQSTISPVLNEHGEVTHLVAIKEDITFRKKLEQELLESLDRAKAADRTKSEFLGVMSHELRTPLNGILGFASLALDSEDLSPEVRDDLAIIESSGRGLLRMLEDILNYTQVEGGAVKLKSLPFSLSEVAWNAARIMDADAKEKNLKLFVSLGGDLPGTVLGDPDRIQQILLNLLRNAIKFTDKGSIKLTITLCSQEKDSYRVLFAVEDTGQGIAEDQQEKIFLPFTQGDSSLSRKYDGVGIGLTIAKRLVERMGSSLLLKSHPGVGSRFYFELSLANATDAREVDDVSGSEIVLDKSFARRFPCKILLVEDNPTNMLVAVKLLGKLGYEAVLKAGSGEEALELLARERVDVIFMDLQMPGIDGLEATRRLRSLEKENPSTVPTKIVALTANADLAVRKKCFECGMNDYVSKPFNAKALAVAIAAGDGNHTKMA